MRAIKACILPNGKHSNLETGLMSVIYFEGGNLLPSGNKGDELMLRVTAPKLRSMCPQFSQAIAPGVAPFEKRCELGLRQLLWPKNPFRFSGNVGYYVLNRYRHQLGLVSEEDISAVVNFQGYRYAEMGAVETALDAKIALERAERGTKHIFLPQAYGPFDSEAVIRNARDLFRNADLIFARDPFSKEFLTETLDTPKEIRIYPDITIGTPGEGSEHTLPKDFAALVPNHWMLHRGSEKDQNAYMDFLEQTIEVSSQQGLEIVILNHSPDLDTPIVKKLLAQEGRAKIQSIEETNALRLKGILAQARFLIGSRYHAIVGALSQNVPAIGTSWSKKYQGLYSDFGADQLLIQPSRDAADIAQLIKNITTGAEREQLVARLNEANERMRKQLDEMWKIVGDTLAT